MRDLRDGCEAASLTATFCPKGRPWRWKRRRTAGGDSGEKERVNMWMKGREGRRAPTSPTLLLLPPPPRAIPYPEHPAPKIISLQLNQYPHRNIHPMTNKHQRYWMRGKERRCTAEINDKKMWEKISSQWLRGVGMYGQDWHRYREKGDIILPRKKLEGMD